MNSKAWHEIERRAAKLLAADEAPTAEQAVALALARDPALYDAWRAERDDISANLSGREEAWAELYALAEKTVSESKVALTIEAALDQVLRTPEGEALYEAYRDPRRATVAVRFAAEGA